MQDRITYFDVFFRRVPDKGGFAIAAGLEQLVDYIKDLHFDEDDIAYLRSKNLFDVCGPGAGNRPIVPLGAAGAKFQHRPPLGVLKPLGITKCGIRLDSGDIAYLTKEARKMLDAAGWQSCTISASNSLDKSHSMS